MFACAALGNEDDTATDHETHQYPDETPTIVSGLVRRLREQGNLGLVHLSDVKIRFVVIWLLILK